MSSSTNQPLVSTRYEQWLERRADARTQEALEEFTLALQSGTIVLPTTDTTAPNYAGGVNYCPNSDLKFSKMAIEVAGAVPGDVGDTNHECYRFYRQEKDADIIEDAAHALKAVTHSLYAANEGTDASIPIWDRVDGQLVFGSDADIWDVAVRLYNNDIKPSRVWHIRFILGAMSDAAAPADLEMYCGIWQRDASGEGWVEGGNFDLNYQIIGIPGTAELNYMVVAQTDSGTVLYSQVLNVPDAPDTFDSDNETEDNEANFPRISYAGAAGGGFISFKIFREDVAAGTFHQIADLRNTNNLLFDDVGGRVNIPLPPITAFPTPTATVSQARAVSQGLDIGAFGAALIINDFTIYVPDGYNWSETLPFSQYLRFGFTRTTAVNRQIRLDEIYLGLSYNRWSDSPFDPKDAIPSTSQTGGTPTSGGSGGPPDEGGGACIREDVPVLRLDFDRQREWLPYMDVPQGDLLENALAEKNLVREKIPGEESEYFMLEFSNGVTLPCNKRHRVRLDLLGQTKSANELQEGESVWGWNNGRAGYTKLIKKTWIKEKGDPRKFGTFALRGETVSGNHFYIAGFSTDENSGVFNKNSKEAPI